MTGPQGRPGQPMGDELTNVLLIAIGGLLGVAFVLRAAGSVAAFLTGMPQPTAGAVGGVADLIEVDTTPCGALVTQIWRNPLATRQNTPSC